MYAALGEYRIDEWLRAVMHQPDWNSMLPDMFKQLLQAVQYLHHNRVQHFFQSGYRFGKTWTNV